jgi:biopolymer transport protein ExbD
MAEVNTGGGEQKKGKPKKMNLRVDFTPMVDMNMLLITFFMFATSLAKPQTMDITMPVKDEKVKEEERSKVAEDKAITIILGEKNKIYYYLGKAPKYSEALKAVKIATYGSAEDKNSLRYLLLSRNRVNIEKIVKLRDMKYRKKITDAMYKEEVKKIRGDKKGQVVIIKPTDASNYKNLVDALDEMQICNIGIYAIVDPTEGDKWFVKNFETNGALAAQSDLGDAAKTGK